MSVKRIKRKTLLKNQLKGNGDINKFILLLRKVVYPYAYMNNWAIFSETSLPDKKDFYSELDLKDITDKDYAHAQKVFKELKV